MAVVEADSTWREPVQGGRVRALFAFGEALEVESRRLMVWSPLLLVCGIWGYFALGREPPGVLAFPVALACVAALSWSRSTLWVRLLAIVALGFAVAQLRTVWVGTPLLRVWSPGQVITGVVADVDVRSKQRFTLVVEVREAKTLPEAERPRRVLVHVTGKHAPPHVGDVVQMTADLAPLPRPSRPGAFDYGRQLYFQSIGSVGRSKVAVEVLAEPAPPKYQVRRWFHAVRSDIGARVKAAIPGPLGSFADALITGERATIPRGMNESLQASGLFHILSISGLHMALVAGGAFWALRAVLALFPPVALRWPIKKWAAGFAIMVGLLYMLLADSGAATERSFIMIAVVFFAVLVDRPALSLHNLALAAVLILLWSPEQALAASFQMSFMAVMGLAAFFQWWSSFVPAPTGLQQRGFIARWGRKIALGVAASLATSLVAGALSGIPAAHHFGRLAPYSVVANALALPVVSLLVMPAAMVSVMLMPLGLEALPLKLMGLGLQTVMLVSDWVASWPGAGVRLPLLGIKVAGLLSVGLAFLLLPVTKLRLLSVPFLVGAGIMFGFGETRPVLLVDERAGNVAMFGPEGLVPAIPKQAAASISRWMAQEGDDAGFKDAVRRTGWSCSTMKCDASHGGLTISFLLKQPVGILRCPKADVIISQEPLRRRCKGARVTIDRFDVWRNGAYAVFADGREEHARSVQGARPWVYEPRARTKP